MTITVAHELIELSHKLVQAVVDRDMALLDELLAAEFTLQGAAGEMGRAEFMEAAAGPYRIDEFSYEQIDPEIYGNTAVLVSRYSQVARLDDRDLSRSMSVTDVWTRRDGRWQIVRRHATVPVGR